MNVLCENGWLALLDHFKVAAVRIRLFVNDHEPDPTDTFGAYVDATFSGYPGYTVLTWGVAFVNDSNQGQVNAASIVWNHSGGAIGQIVYGVFITDEDDNLLWADRFDAPVSMTTDDDSIEYQPQLTMINQ